MRQIAVLLLILVVSANATSLFDQYPINFGPKRSIMTLLTQVEAQLKMGGPLDAITKMLQEFVTAVTEEQVQHDALHTKQEKECKDEFKFRKTEITDAKNSLQQAQETLDGCNSQEVRAKQDLQVTNRQLTENRNQLSVIEETRRREAYAFETATKVYQASSRAVEEALVILQEIWSGETKFVQLSKHVNGMLKTAVKIRQAHLLAGVMSALAQLASKDLQADEALLERVKTMLKNFREKIEAQFQNAAKAEQKAVAAYNEDKKRLQSTIAHLEQQKTGLEAELQELQKCIVTQTGIVNAAVTKRDRNQRLLDDATNLCTSVDAEYKTATAARKEELDLLSAIRERVEARFGQMSKDVQDRGKQDTFTYKNEYAEDKQTFKASTAK